MLFINFATQESHEEKAPQKADALIKSALEYDENTVRATALALATQLGDNEQKEKAFQALTSVFLKKYIDYTGSEPSRKTNSDQLRKYVALFILENGNDEQKHEAAICLAKIRTHQIKKLTEEKEEILVTPLPMVHTSLNSYDNGFTLAVKVPYKKTDGSEVSYAIERNVNLETKSDSAKSLLKSLAASSFWGKE